MTKEEAEDKLINKMSEKLEKKEVLVLSFAFQFFILIILLSRKNLLLLSSQGFIIGILLLFSLLGLIFLSWSTLYRLRIPLFIIYLFLIIYALNLVAGKPLLTPIGGNLLLTFFFVLFLSILTGERRTAFWTAILGSIFYFLPLFIKPATFSGNDLFYIPFFFAVAIFGGELSREERLTRYRLLERKVKEIRAIYQIDESLLSVQRLNKILPDVLKMVGDLMNVHMVSMRLFDEGKKELLTRGSIDISSSYLSKEGIKVGESIAGKVFKEKRPYISKNLIKDPFYKYSALAKKENIYSLLSVPLLIKGKNLGVLTCYSRLPSRFTRDDLFLLSFLANQLAVNLENNRLYEEMRQGQLDTISSFLTIINSRDSYTLSHSRQVANLVTLMAKEMKLFDEEKHILYWASLFHDIGKIAISDQILQKPESLTPEEFKVITTHPAEGVKIIKKISFLKNLVPLILHHHEKINGNGYPRGLKGKEIPKGARILKVADAYSAIISKRPYRDALSKEDAVKILTDGKNIEFDPYFVDILLTVLEKK